MEQVKKILCNCAQDLSNNEKAQARRNIDAQATLTAGRNITISDSNVISAEDAHQVQADWTETDSTADSYIQHKPNVPSIVSTTTTLPPVNTNIDQLKFFTNGRVMGDSTQLGLIAPTGTQTDAGKVLTLHYSGSPGITTAQWDSLPANVEIATVTHSQAGAVETPVQKLVIDEDFGTLEADNHTVGLVAPVPTSADNGKLVAVNGDLLEYVDAPNGVFVAWYSGYSTGHGNTTFNEIRDAHAEGKMVILKSTVSGGDVIRILDNIDSTKAVFTRTCGAISGGGYGNVVNQIVVLWAANEEYQVLSTNLQSAFSTGPGIHLTNNELSADVYKAEIKYVNGQRTCSYAAIVAAADAGKVVLLGEEGSGTFAGKLKYYNSSYALFDNFVAQPMRMTEIFVNTDNSITMYTRYMFDTTVGNNWFHATRTATQFFQNNVSNLEWSILQYVTTVGNAQWYKGANTAVTYATDVYPSLMAINQYQLLSIAVSGSICHTVQSQPSGTPLGAIQLRFQTMARRISDHQYSYFEIAESPLVMVDASDYSLDGSTYKTPWHNFSMELTLDRFRLGQLGFNTSNYDDFAMVVTAKLLNYDPSGTGSIHNLGIKNMAVKYTLKDHL